MKNCENCRHSCRYHGELCCNNHDYGMVVPMRVWSCDKCKQWESKEEREEKEEKNDDR